MSLGISGISTQPEIGATRRKWVFVPERGRKPRDAVCDCTYYRIPHFIKLLQTCEIICIQKSLTASTVVLQDAETFISNFHNPSHKHHHALVLFHSLLIIHEGPQIPYNRSRHLKDLPNSLWCHPCDVVTGSSTDPRGFSQNNPDSRAPNPPGNVSFFSEEKDQTIVLYRRFII